MKKTALLKFIVDIISVPFIIVIAYSLKFKIGWIKQNIFNIDSGLIYQHAQIEPYLENIYLLMIIWSVTLYSSGLYKQYKGVMSDVDEFVQIVKALTYTLFLITAISFFINLIPHSRYVIFYGWLSGIVLMTLSHFVINTLVRQIKKLPNCCVLGCTSAALNMTERIVSNSEFSYNYLGSFGKKPSEDIPYLIKESFNYLGTERSLKKYLRDNDVSALFIVKESIDEDKIDDLIIFCETNNIQIHIYHPTSVALSGVATYEDIAGIPLLSYKQIPFSIRDSFIKRSFDILFSLLLLILSSPLSILTMLWIKIVSPGPVLFKQERVGFEGKPFLIYKFRTMPINAESKSGPQYADENETRYIKGGKFLRKFSIDEIPQLINVLKNDMSLIGPRPERPMFVEQICETAPYFNLRHRIKGGLSGWAQIHGRAALTKKPIEKFKYDLYYIKNWSLVLDIKILIKSFFVVLKGEEAY